MRLSSEILEDLIHQAQELRRLTAQFEMLSHHVRIKFGELERMANEYDDNGNCPDSNVRLIIARLKGY